MGAERLELTADEKARLLAGDDTALKREHKPSVKEGSVIVLRRQAAHREPLYEDKHDPRKITGSLPVPERRLVWIEVTNLVRHRKGHWQIEIDLHDARQKVRRLGPSAPPVGGGISHFDDETARGYGGGKAIDELEAVDDDELHRQRVKAEARAAELADEDKADERAAKQQRAIRQMLKEGVRDLGPTTGQAWLARIERMAREAKDELEKAA